MRLNEYGSYEKKFAASLIKLSISKLLDKLIACRLQVLEASVKSVIIQM